MTETRETVRDVMEKAYYHEETVNHNILVSLNLPYTMVAAGIGISVFLVRQLPTQPDGTFWWTSTIFLALALVMLGYAAYHVITAALGQSKRLYIDMNGMRNYFDQLCSYYRDQGGDDPRSNALADFQDALIAEYSGAATHNKNLNYVRVGKRSHALSALLGAGACLFISAIALTLEEFTEKADGSERNGQPQAERASGCISASLVKRPSAAQA